MAIRTEMLNNKYPQNMHHEASAAAPVAVDLNSGMRLLVPIPVPDAQPVSA